MSNDQSCSQRDRNMHNPHQNGARNARLLITPARKQMWDKQETFSTPSRGYLHKFWGEMASSSLVYVRFTY